MSTADRAILFADVVGSTTIYRRLGDAVAEEVIRGAMARVTALAQAEGGRLIKTIGDCAMCEFATADAAARAAMEIQRSASEPLPSGQESVLFRVGFMSGAVVDRDNDVFGDAVNLAARLCDIAKSEQILTIDSVGSALSADLRSSVRLFDQAPIKGITGSAKIVQLLWNRRAATQIFIAPTDMELSSAANLILHYADQRISVMPAQLPFSIGRENGCSLVVPTPYASRVHALIELHRGKFALIDESTNGTYVLPDGVEPDRFVYVRREVFPLLGSGIFALGERPQATAEHVLRFEVL